MTVVKFCHNYVIYRYVSSGYMLSSKTAAIMELLASPVPLDTYDFGAMVRSKLCFVSDPSHFDVFFLKLRLAL